MPELPEVEVTRQMLVESLVGRHICRVETTAPSYVFLTPPSQLKKRLLGRVVRQLERRGKYILALLDDDSRLLIHLGMTGQLFTELAQNPRLVRKTQAAPTAAAERFQPDAHTHLQLGFSDPGPNVYFRDVRKFGKLRWLKPGQADARLDKLGVDALAATGRELFDAAQRRKTPIKSLLLDQSVLAGCGNIYADEALFRARIAPLRPASEVTRTQCVTVVNELKQVLLRSIATGGSSMSDYVTPSGADGAYQKERLVYAREGEPCTRCGKPILRLVIGQRSSHYCAACQR